MPGPGTQQEIAGSVQDGGAPLVRLARSALLIYLALLAWMKLPLSVRGLDALPMDFVFLLAGASWATALLAGQARFRWHPAFWLLLAYFAAIGASAFISDDPQRSGFKLLTQAYLLLLPVLTFNLFDSRARLRRAFLWWLAGAAAVALLGAATLLSFPVLGPDTLLDPVLHSFGTLPAGPYPRLELTFLYPSLLANYLGVSLMLLLLAERMAWLGRAAAIGLGIAMIATAFFALTPGFGGILFMVGLWFWHIARDRRPASARLALVLGLAMPILAVVVSAVSPALYPTAPYLIDLPALDATVAPSARLLAWSDALANFLASPVLGHGIGVDAVEVRYEVSDCSEGCMTDAHNMFLNIAAQTGIVGLAGLAAILWFPVRQLLLSLPVAPRDPLVLGLSLAWVSGFAIQGLVGSFEDSRHLWLLFGLLLSASAMRGREEGA